MLNLSEGNIWKKLLEKDSKLKELAIKVGIENNPTRAQELNGCFALNCGSDVVSSEEEREVAMYLFCTDFEENSLSSIVEQRILIAKKAQTEL